MDNYEAQCIKDENVRLKKALHLIRDTLGDFQEEWSDRERRVDAIAHLAMTECSGDKPHKNLQRLYSLKYGSQIAELLFKDDMTQDEKDEMIGFFEEKVNSIESLDEDIEIGVKNGYSVEFQIDLAKNLIFFREMKEGNISDAMKNLPSL
jgi:hypothetical protein